MITDHRKVGIKDGIIEIPLWFIVSSIFLQHEEWDVRQKYESSMIYRTVFARAQLMRRTKILPSLGRQHWWGDSRCCQVPRSQQLISSQLKRNINCWFEKNLWWHRLTRSVFHLKMQNKLKNAASLPCAHCAVIRWTESVIFLLSWSSKYGRPRIRWWLGRSIEKYTVQNEALFVNLPTPRDVLLQIKLSHSLRRGKYWSYMWELSSIRMCWQSKQLWWLGRARRGVSCGHHWQQLRVGGERRGHDRHVTSR